MSNLKLPPPSRRPPPDSLDIELRDMSDRIVRGMPSVPPPPTPGARPAHDDDEQQQPEIDVGRIITRVPILVLFVVMAALFYACWNVPYVPP